MANEAKKKILIYLLLAFALSAVFYWLILVGAKGKSGELLIFGLMWCPGVAALARLDAPEVRQPVDGGDPPRQP